MTEKKLKKFFFFLALLASLPNFNDDVDTLTGDSFVINVSGGDFFSCFFLFQAVLRTQRALVDYRIFFHFVNLEYTALLMYRSGSVRVTGDCSADSRKLKFLCCSSPTFLRNDKALQCKVRTYDNFLIARIFEQVVYFFSS